MNSDEWEQLWREQSVPPSAVSLIRFNAEMRDGKPEEWERDIDHHERLLVWLGMVSLLTSAPMLFLGVFKWGAWGTALTQILLLGWYLTRRFERRRIYRDFGTSLRERMDRMERLLRARHEHWRRLGMPIAIMAAFGWAMVMRLQDMGLDWKLVMVVGMLFAVIAIYSAFAQARRDRKQLTKDLRRIEWARSQLGREAEPE